LASASERPSFGSEFRVERTAAGSIACQFNSCGAVVSVNGPSGT